MMKQSTGDTLIQELVANPAGFDDTVKGCELLQEYFDGFPLGTLRTLLGHDNGLVRRSAAFIASELGMKASSLIDDVITLVSDSDKDTQWYAFESVMVCSCADNVDKFPHVLRGLESADGPIRRLVMRLVSRADPSQLEAGVRLHRRLGSSGELHKLGLTALLTGELLNPEQVVTMIDDSRPLVRKYGAIAAKSLRQEFPELLAHAALSTDADVSKFSDQCQS